MSSSARLCNRGSSVKCPLVVVFFCSHLFALSSRSERLAGNLFVPGWLLSVLSGSPLSRNVRKARVECNLIMLGLSLNISFRMPHEMTQDNEARSIESFNRARVEGLDRNLPL